MRLTEHWYDQRNCKNEIKATTWYKKTTTQHPYVYKVTYTALKVYNYI